MQATVLTKPHRKNSARSQKFERFERFVFKNLIEIYLHANYLLGLLNTNCTNYTNMLLATKKKDP